MTIVTTFSGDVDLEFSRIILEIAVNKYETNKIPVAD